MPALFALDHNYPLPIVHDAAPYMPSVELVPLTDIDARLPGFEDDWRILLALHHHDRPWDGLISNDASMLDQAAELAVLIYTGLTLVAPVAAGHDPVKSTGLLLTHVENIAARTTPRRPQVWRLAARSPGGDHPDRYLEKRARMLGVDPQDLRRQGEPPRAELERDPLE